MRENMSGVPLEKLLGRLHDLMRSLVSDVDSIIADNNEVSIDDVRKLRDHIKGRMGVGEELRENGMLLKLLNLFSEDKAVLEIIREDSNEWSELLENIENSIKGNGSSAREKREIKEIRRLTSEIRDLVRK